MYDFYANPPETKEHVRKYLWSWLQPVSQSETNVTVMFENNQWIMSYGFRRADCYHQVFVNTTTGEYGFNADNSDWDGNQECNMGTYSSFDEMLEGVSTKYAQLWNLP